MAITETGISCYLDFDISEEHLQEKLNDFQDAEKQIKAY